MAANAPKKTNWFAIWISIAVVVVVVGAGGLVVWMNNNVASGGTAPSANPSASGSVTVRSDTGAIVVGSGPRQLDTYVDFMCPICNQFEQAYGETIDAAVAAGSITLNIHPIAILDNQSQGTAYSTRAASAMYCVAESNPDQAVAFMKAMYANQPEEGTAGLTNDQIAEVATSVGADAAAPCIGEGKFRAFVTARTKDTPLMPGQSRIGTPTIALDGKTFQLTGDPAADITAKLQ